MEKNYYVGQCPTCRYTLNLVIFLKSGCKVGTRAVTVHHRGKRMSFAPVMHRGYQMSEISMIPPEMCERSPLLLLVPGKSSPEGRKRL